MAPQRRPEARAENRLDGLLAASPETFSNGGADGFRNFHGDGKREMFPIVSFWVFACGPALASVPTAGFADDPSDSVQPGWVLDRFGGGKAPFFPERDESSAEFRSSARFPVVFWGFQADSPPEASVLPPSGIQFENRVDYLERSGKFKFGLFQPTAHETNRLISSRVAM
jgi:hypothetical protein